MQATWIDLAVTLAALGAGLMAGVYFAFSGFIIRADGLVVTFVYDAALTGAVQRVDRIWLGTESIGEHTFLGRVGTRAMLEHAKACDVPAMVLATSATRSSSCAFGTTSLTSPMFSASTASKRSPVNRIRFACDGPTSAIRPRMPGWA